MKGDNVVTTMPSGCKVHSNESRVAIQLPSESNHTKLHDGWNALSSATHNGGLRSFPANDCGVINIQVPASYDGMNPLPIDLICNAIKNDNIAQFNVDTTIGMMTAAHMKTLRTSTRSSTQGVVVETIVTAGISNARSAGADADCFFLQSDSRNDEKLEPGTINTVVIIHAPLSEPALIEAYAIAVEAKCAACADWSVTCAKSGRIAQGTGTDCMVMMCPSTPTTCQFASSHNCSDEANINSNLIEYAGKHMVLGEFIGQTVREATREAIRCNINQIYGSIWRYHCRRYMKWMTNLILTGAQPCVPPYPMMSVPPAPVEVLVLGIALIGLSYLSGCFLPRRATILLAAASWDRCLPSVPLTIHPVVLAGRVISFVTNESIPKRVYNSPILGFLAGVVFLMGMLSLFVIGGHLFLHSGVYLTQIFLGTICHYTHENHCSDNRFVLFVREFTPWIQEVAFVETTFSLQLLCTIALQMAKFLERSQIDEARSQLSWLCSRDPSALNKEELAGATLESLAENLSDGTIAPWFWFIAFGPLGALGYRIANTLDSRVGYRGGQYEWFGKPSARFDDIINLIPARVTAILLCFAAYIVSTDGSDAKNGLMAAWNDSSQCSSPNAGWPMGCMAGLLGVRLEKKGEYCLGKCLSSARDPSSDDIRSGYRIAQLAGGLALLVSVCTILFI